MSAEEIDLATVTEQPTQHNPILEQRAGDIPVKVLLNLIHRIVKHNVVDNKEQEKIRDQQRELTERVFKDFEDVMASTPFRLSTEEELTSFCNSVRATWSIPGSTAAVAFAMVKK